MVRRTQFRRRVARPVRRMNRSTSRSMFVRRPIRRRLPVSRRRFGRR